MRYFNIKEFHCNCCDKQEMKQEFLEFIDELRARCEFPFRVTSGWRCENKQKELTRLGYKTAKNTRSPHLDGFAADIAVSDSTKRAYFVGHALQLTNEKQVPFRLGIAGRDNGSFIHIDIAPKSNPRIWIY